MEWTARIGALCVLALAGLSGCSADAPEPPGKEPAEKQKAPSAQDLSPPIPRLVADGSPARTVTDFYSALQYRDMPAAYSMLTAQAQTEYAQSLPRFSARILADQLHWFAKPVVLFTRRGPGTTTVAVRYQLEGAAPETTSFTLRREDGRWKIDFEAYLVNRLTVRPE